MDKWLENKELPYHLVSACGLVSKDGQVLLIRNPKRGWELPGGTAEQGESVTEALKILFELKKHETEIWKKDDHA